MSFYVGLDLGQSADYTALAIVQETQQQTDEGIRVQRLHLRHLERYPLRTPYPDMVDKVAALMRDPRLSPEEQEGFRIRRRPPKLVVDATGVGAAVTDLLRKQGLRFTAVTITGGDKVHRSDDGRGWRVPKRDLVAALEVPFHTGTLEVAEGLELWGTLRSELLSFRRKINLKTAHDSYEHWRETDHDDLVLACALACWEVRRPKSVLRVIR